MTPGTPTKAEKAKKKAMAEATKALRALKVTDVHAKLGRDRNSAIDDSDDVDSDYAKRQQSLTRQRRAEKRGGKVLSIQDILPFKVVPIVLPLSIRDLESAVALDNAAFTNPEHRASRETLEYRLRTCPGLCLGLFCTVLPTEAEAKGWHIETLPTAHDVETGRQNGAKHVLLACVIATKALGNYITDADMAYPEDWKALNGISTQLGHQKSGRAIAVHSVAVAPKLQGHGLGKLIVKSYIQHMSSAGMGDRIVLRAQHRDTGFFKRFGFDNNGPSSALSAGIGFHDMALKLPGQKTATPLTEHQLHQLLQKA